MCTTHEANPIVIAVAVGRGLARFWCDHCKCWHQHGRTVYDRSGPDDDEFIFDAEPIIGWAVDGSYSLPITASEGIVEDTERRIAVAPASTGATWRAFEYSRSYHDEDKARADLELEWRKARDEKLAKAGEP